MFNFFKKTKKTNIKMVRDIDFIDYLKKIGAYNLIESGREKCYFCGSRIDDNNIEAIVPKAGEIKFICSHPKCFSKTIKYAD
jgi:hypothetical protein